MPDQDTGPDLNAVQLPIEGEGLALIIYGPGPDFCVYDVTFVPADQLDDEQV